MTGHNSSDGTDMCGRLNKFGEWNITIAENCSYGHNNAIKIILQLIIDAGVPSRGHRTNIYNDQLKVTGIALGPHSAYTHSCTLDYAGEFNSF